MILTYLKTYRETAFLAQEKLAQKAGLSRETIAKAEAGRSVSATTAAKLAKALRCKVEALI